MPLYAFLNQQMENNKQAKKKIQTHQTGNNWHDWAITKTKNDNGANYHNRFPIVIGDLVKVYF